MLRKSHLCQSLSIGLCRFQPHSDRSATALGDFVQARVLLGLHPLLRRNELLGDPLSVLSLPRRDWRRQDRQVESLRQSLQQHRQIRQSSPGSKILLFTLFFKARKGIFFEKRSGHAKQDHRVHCWKDRFNAK